jgi:hypothetical protein
MAIPKTPLIAGLLRFAGRLKFKQLFFITGGLFVLDLLVPDFVPLIDELILGLLTLLFAAWKNDKQQEEITDPAIIEGEAERVNESEKR